MKALRLVVDANVVLSAFLRDGVTRELLLHAPLELYAPDWLATEVERNLIPLSSRRGIPRSVARALLDRLFQGIHSVPEPVLAHHAAEALRRCKASGPKDAPYVACALAVNAGLWTHDRKLTGEAGVRVLTTAGLRARFLE